MVETFVHVAKLVSLALVASALLAGVGGWALRFLEPWDKDVLREPERPADPAGRDG